MSKRLSIAKYKEGLLSGNRVVLAKCITLIESRLPSDQLLAEALLDEIIPHTGKALRIGISGVPGVGKSTFIESFGNFLTEQGHKVAVLAVDPSSKLSKGSILGDKTRMNQLAVNQNAFIRPSPASGALGGVGSKTRETILLCETAGYDRILVETVGVGQSETMVRDMVDFFLLLMLAGAGDELQGIKRGIMELCDALIINKADGENILPAERAATEYKNALHLFREHEAGWIPPVKTISSLSGRGIDEVHRIVELFSLQTKTNGFFSLNRHRQQISWLNELVRDDLQRGFEAFKNQNEIWLKEIAEIESGVSSVRGAFRRIMDTYQKVLQG